MQSNIVQGFRQGKGKKVVVFEDGQKTKIEDDAQPKPKIPTFFLLAFFYLDSREIAQKGWKQQQEQETPIPTGIEIITHHDQESVLRAFGFAENKPMKQKNYRQKKGKG